MKRLILAGIVGILGVVAVAGATVGGASTPDVGTDVAASDAAIEQVVRPLDEQLGLAIEKAGLTGTDADFQEASRIRDERHDTCREMVIAPEVAHSAFVEDVCSSTLRELRESGA